MTQDDFAGKIKEKYPQYSSLPNDELVTKIVAKYPQYSSQIDGAGGAPAAPTDQKPGFFQSMVQGAAKPFLRAGVSVAKTAEGVAGLGLYGLGKLVKSDKVASLGYEAASNAADTKPVDMGYFGKISPIGFGAEGEKLKPADTAKDIVGSGLDVASWFAGGGEAKAGAEALKEGGVQAIKTAAKAGAEVGALQGAGGSLQSEAGAGHSAGRQVADVTLGTLLGGAAGAVFGGTVSAGVEAARLGKNIIAPSDKFAEKIQTDLTENYRAALKLKPTQIKLENQWGKDTPEFLARESVYNPDIRLKQNGGKLDTGDAVAALQKMAKSENGAFAEILKSQGKYVSLEDYRRAVLRDIDTPQNRAKGSEYESMIEHANKEVDALKKNYAGGKGAIAEGEDVKVPLDVFNEIKQGRWAVTRGFMTASDKVYGDTNFAMGQTAKGIIEQSIDDADARAINKRLGDIASAVKVLEDRDGTVLAGGRMGRWTAAKIGSVVGLPAGPGGAITGALTGEKLAEVMQNPEISNGVKRWLLVRAQQMPDYETVSQQAEKILGSKLQEAADRKMLPAPSFMPMGGDPAKGATPGRPNYNPPAEAASSPSTFFDPMKAKTVVPDPQLALPAPSGAPQFARQKGIGLPADMKKTSGNFFGP